MWKMQLLDEHHLFIKYTSEDVVTLRVTDPSQVHTHVCVRTRALCWVFPIASCLLLSVLYEKDSFFLVSEGRTALLKTWFSPVTHSGYQQKNLIKPYVCALKNIYIFQTYTRMFYCCFVFFTP